MAVVIRFSRHGRKGMPFYRVVAADKQFPRDGRYLEILGTYNPRNKEARFNREKIQGWLKVGAVPSPTVMNLLRRSGTVPGGEGVALS